MTKTQMIGLIGCWGVDVKVKTSDLVGSALDWAVDEALGYGDVYLKWWNEGGDKRMVHCEIMRHYSGHWDLVGPIIERRGVSTSKVLANTGTVGCWSAHIPGGNGKLLYGPTPLIAAARCFVASKLGDEVDVPKELLT